jgi:hypothetical protein
LLLKKGAIVMRLPKQVKPVMRKASTAGIKDGVNPSLFGIDPCANLNEQIINLQRQMGMLECGRRIETEREL